jgi:hypothetical protein
MIESRDSGDWNGFSNNAFSAIELASSPRDASMQSEAHRSSMSQASRDRMLEMSPASTELGRRSEELGAAANPTKQTHRSRVTIRMIDFLAAAGFIVTIVVAITLIGL